MVAALSAIAEPRRFEIVELLREGPRSVSEIVDALGLRQPQVSKHLRVLSEAGVVERTPQAQLRVYSLRPQPFEELETWAGSFRKLWNERLDALNAVAQELKKERRAEDGEHA